MRDFLVVACLLVALIFAYREARQSLPEGAPAVATTQLKEQASISDKGAVMLVMATESWEIEDFGLVKFATGRKYGLTLMADPVSKKWRLWDTREERVTAAR